MGDGMLLLLLFLVPLPVILRRRYWCVKGVSVTGSSGRCGNSSGRRALGRSLPGATVWTVCKGVERSQRILQLFHGETEELRTTMGQRLHPGLGNKVIITISRFWEVGV